jgi:hypothetical protein
LLTSQIKSHGARTLGPHTIILLGRNALYIAATSAGTFGSEEKKFTKVDKEVLFAAAYIWWIPERLWEKGEGKGSIS